MKTPQAIKLQQNHDANFGTVSILYHLQSTQENHCDNFGGDIRFE